MLIGNNKYQWT